MNVFLPFFFLLLLHSLLKRFAFQVRRSPLSEACRGVLTCCQMLGLNDHVRNRDLEAIRAFFESLDAKEYVDQVFKKAGVEYTVMTNQIFDAVEVKRGKESLSRGDVLPSMFKTSLRIDHLIFQWESSL